MKLYPYATASPLSGALRHRNLFLLRLMTAVLSLGCVVVLSIVMYSARRNETMAPSRISQDDLAAVSSSGLEAQTLDVPRYRINVDAFDAKRKVQLASDCRKLVLLAIAVRSELQLNPNQPPSRDAVQKMKEIEKLAHEVKDKMTFSPGPVF